MLLPPSTKPINISDGPTVVSEPLSQEVVVPEPEVKPSIGEVSAAPEIETICKTGYPAAAAKLSVIVCEPAATFAKYHALIPTGPTPISTEVAPAESVTLEMVTPCGWMNKTIVSPALEVTTQLVVAVEAVGVFTQLDVIVGNAGAIPS